MWVSGDTKEGWRISQDVQAVASLPGSEMIFGDTRKLQLLESPLLWGCVINSCLNILFFGCAPPFINTALRRTEHQPVRSLLFIPNAAHFNGQSSLAAGSRWPVEHLHQMWKNHNESIYHVWEIIGFAHICCFILSLEWWEQLQEPPILNLVKTMVSCRFFLQTKPLILGKFHLNLPMEKGLGMMHRRMDAGELFAAAVQVRGVGKCGQPQLEICESIQPGMCNGCFFMLKYVEICWSAHFQLENLEIAQLSLIVLARLGLLVQL